MGSQFLKVAMPKDAISLQATVRTASGVHKMTIDRWGDTTHKYDHYNSRRHPTHKDSQAIRRYEAEKAVLSPLPSPMPVLRRREQYRRNLRAEGLRNEYHEDGGRSWNNQRNPTPRRERRRSPYYPPSPRYETMSSDDEGRDPIIRPQPPSAAQGAPQDPWASPEGRQGDLDDIPELEEVPQLDGQGEGSEGFSSGDPDPKVPTNTPIERPGTPVIPIPKNMQKFLDSTAKLDQVLEEALEGMELEEDPVEAGASSAPPPGILKRAKTIMNLEQNKVEHMDKIDAQIANPGRHRDTEYGTAQVHHVVFRDPPASPDPEEEETNKRPPNNPQSGIVPLEPEIVVANKEEEISQQNPPDSDCEIVEENAAPFPEKPTWAQMKMIKARKTLALKIPRVKVSPCRCARPDICTSEATSTTAEDSGNDSEDLE